MTKREWTIIAIGGVAVVVVFAILGCLILAMLVRQSSPEANPVAVSDLPSVTPAQLLTQASATQVKPITPPQSSATQLAPTAPSVVTPTSITKPLPTVTRIAPTASPTSSKPQLEILSHQSYTASGWFFIVGEVRNNSSRPMEYVKVVATLYDATGKVVGTDFAYTELDVIPPGEKAPFETGTDKYAGVTKYNVQVQGREGSLPRQDLVIVSHNSYTDKGWLFVRGEVKNTGTTPAEYIKIVVTLYNKAGGVVGKDFAYTDLDTVSPGGTSPFETGTDHWTGFDHYSIQVQGR